MVYDVDLQIFNFTTSRMGEVTVLVLCVFVQKAQKIQQSISLSKHHCVHIMQYSIPSGNFPKNVSFSSYGDLLT